MITKITLHVSHGVQNYNSGTKFTWYGTNFNQSVPNFFDVSSPFTRYSGPLTYLTETLTYNLVSIDAPGKEICNCIVVADFQNDGASTYYLNTNFYFWDSTPSYQPIMWFNNGTNWVQSIPPGYYTEYWNGGNIGTAPWEMGTNATYHFHAYTSGTPSIATVIDNLSVSNVPYQPYTSINRGAIWVEGTSLCYIDAGGNSGQSYGWKQTMSGVYVGFVASWKQGALWIDSSTNQLHWIGNDGNEYRCVWRVQQVASFYSNGPTGTVYAGPSKAGAIWVDTAFGQTHIAYIATNGYKYLTGSGADPYA